MQFLREVRLEGVGEHRWALESGEGEIHPTLKAPWHSGHAVALPDVEQELDEAAPVEARGNAVATTTLGRARQVLPDDFDREPEEVAQLRSSGLTPAANNVDIDAALTKEQGNSPSYSRSAAGD